MSSQSSENCLSPVNISSSDPSIKECNIYCTYQYDYNDSSCIVSTNKNDSSGNYLDIKYDSKNSGTSHQCIFNGRNYNVNSVRVYQPSLHTYNGQYVPVEFLIFHDGPTDNQGNTIKLIVSIPYQSGTASSNYSSSKTGGQVLENIINDYYKLSPPPTSSSTPQNLNINNFNLNNFIPNAQYYYYVGPELPKYGVCSKTTTTNYVLFDTTNAAQYISSDAITKLQGLISKSAFPIKQNTLYKSAKFPNSNSAAAKANDIYIDCNPTGTEGEELYKKVDTSKGKVSSIQNLVDSLKNSGLVQFLSSIIVSIVLIWVIKKAFFSKKDASGGSVGGSVSSSVSGGVNNK
jgi:carbonic anhydrase